MNHERDTSNSSTAHRQILINEPQPRKFCSNSISTTKYTVFTFLPLFLYEQFHNYTNCFFLLISIIQQFPEASSLGRYTTIIPLSIILSVSAIKEILEDLRRYRADSSINSKTVEVYRHSIWSRVAWRSVQVGELVRVYSDEFIPADMLFLAGSSHNGDNSVCYIETVNLDGENNYKIRHRVPGSNASVATLRATVQCDLPNENIYDFKGVFKRSGSETKIPLSTNNMLLRGSILRNTNWIIGAVVYTGYDTKIMKNSSSTRLKRSSVSKMVNTHIIVLFILFLCLTITHWLLFLVWNASIYEGHSWYLPLLKHDDLFDGSTLIVCLIYGVIYSIVIPISLPVMQELSRFIQAIFITNDPNLYDEETDTPTLVRTSSLNEDLALVKYIFTDKTGTLTKNVLEFKFCAIRGTEYSTERLKHVNSVSNRSAHDITNFFVAIAVCPGVIPVGKRDDIVYYASSPDQKTLVTTASDIGIVLLQRTHNMVKLRVRGTVRTFEIKCDFEFTSDRKRTSVIVRDPEHGLLLCAIGSDDAIVPRSVQDESIERTQEYIKEFSSKGMRSICVAMAKVSDGDFNSWYPSYKRANEALRDKDELMAEAESAILKNLTLLGATAVEDKLQDHVPQTIDALLQAGINLWMLTGDKQETALNIGFACHLLKPSTPLIVLNEEDLHELRRTIAHYKHAMGDHFGMPGHNHGLLMNGGSLKMLFDSKVDVDSCISLMLSCRAVICYRTTPKQKALIVENVQKRTHYVTLAIGDGANDVAMIQTASIGIGISGLEGLQAANAADYSIAQFKYLRRLLLVHGTWCYNRICKMIFFIYYKNVAIALLQFFYVSTNVWSGFVFFDRWAKMLYNVLLTSLPTLALGVFEKNLPEKELLSKPHVYMQNNWFKFSTFCSCLLNALFHSILLLSLSLTVFKDNVAWPSGLNDHYGIVGSMVYTGLLLVVTLKSALHTCYWTSLTFFCLVTSFAIWPVVLLILSHTWPYIGIGEDIPRVFESIVISPLFWVYLAFAIVAVLALDLVVIVVFRMFRGQALFRCWSLQLSCINPFSPSRRSSSSGPSTVSGRRPRSPSETSLPEDTN